MEIWTIVRRAVGTAIELELLEEDGSVRTSLPGESVVRLLDILTNILEDINDDEARGAKATKSRTK